GVPTRDASLQNCVHPHIWLSGEASHKRPNRNQKNSTPAGVLFSLKLKSLKAAVWFTVKYT
ncbi:MAG: hypothetical protein RSC58_06590, partial [Ruthenibacterium sp.]